MKEDKCKICRRVGQKLFLKGEKCFSPKCIMIRKNYPPGAKGKRRKREISEYGKGLKEKQKLKKSFGISEKQLRRYVREMLLEKKRKKIDSINLLIQKLETRLDNTVFRLGFAFSRSIARQLVSHGHFMVNNRKVNIPSFQVKKGDIISIKESSKKKGFFSDLDLFLKKHQPPSWLSLDKAKQEGKVVGLLDTEEVTSQGINIPLILESYNR